MFGLCPKCWNERYKTGIDDSRLPVTNNEKICKCCGKITNVVLTDYSYETNIWYIRETEILIESIFFLFLLPYIIYRRIKYNSEQKKKNNNLHKTSM